MSMQPPASAPPSYASPAHQPARRPSFWVGFALGFALLTIGSCTALGIALGFGRLSLSEIRGDGSSWAPPTLMPTPEMDPQLAGGSGSATGTGRFAAGDTLVNITGSRVNLRRTPGHLGKDASDVLAQLEPGSAVVLLGESTQANNLTWWRVAYQGHEGWVAEATASGVQILGEP